jgi:hypothetical protein
MSEPTPEPTPEPVTEPTPEPVTEPVDSGNSLFGGKSRKNNGKSANSTSTKRRFKMRAVGSRASVFNGFAQHTSGMLYKKDLMKNSRDRIVSRKKHFSEKKSNKLKGYKPFTKSNNPHLSTFKPNVSGKKMKKGNKTKKNKK